MDTAIFTTTLGQMVYLLLLLAAGFLLVRAKVIQPQAAGVLSRLENMLLIPAFVMGTFLRQFTRDMLAAAGKLLLGGFALAAVFILISVPLVRLCTKDHFLRRIYLYGLSFSNFGFMGNAVVAAIFPEILPQYLVFTIAFWVLINLWGAPVLLMGEDAAEKPTVGKRLRSLVNPMFIAMLIGMLLGLSGWKIPTFISGAVDAVGACMSPIAMLLTGMTVACIDLRRVFRTGSIYAVTVLRLLVYPLIGIVAFRFLPLPDVFEQCAVCVLAMPLGLNTVVIPSAYGRDPTAAAGMALISHALSCLTIPVMFLLLTNWV